MSQCIVTLDLEGVLVPEIWIAVAQKTGVEGLLKTTRDIPDYDELMRGRLQILAEHGLGLKDIQRVISELEPLPGAAEFLDQLRGEFQVIILSDTFREFAGPLMEQLNRPTIFCHSLVVDAGGRVTDYRLRQPDQKRRAVEALKGLSYRVLAAGDSFNDTTMLGAADAGFLFHAPENIRQAFPQFPAYEEYSELLEAFRSAATV